MTTTDDIRCPSCGTTEGDLHPIWCEAAFAPLEVIDVPLSRRTLGVALLALEEWMGIAETCRDDSEGEIEYREACDAFEEMRLMLMTLRDAAHRTFLVSTD